MPQLVALPLLGKLDQESKLKSLCAVECGAVLKKEAARAYRWSLGPVALAHPQSKEFRLSNTIKHFPGDESAGENKKFGNL